MHIDCCGDRCGGDGDFVDGTGTRSVVGDGGGVLVVVMMVIVAVVVAAVSICCTNVITGISKCILNETFPF